MPGNPTKLEPSHSVEYPTTQRAYTLRLRGAGSDDHSWRDALWATHEAVNNGVRGFGDWLLTLRGGLDHELATPPEAEKQRTDEELAAVVKSRRILLALSWLSVEDEQGAPKGALRVATGSESAQVRADKLVSALREILAKRRMDKRTIDAWVGDCSASLAARIREDAVWVNRSAAFDEQADRLDGLNRKYANETTFSLFGPDDAYFALPSGDQDEDEGGAGAGDGPEFKELARAMVSRDFGTGTKSDAAAISTTLRKLASSDLSRFVGQGKDDLIAHMAGIVGGRTPDLVGLLAAVGWKGRSSKGRMAIEALPARLSGAAIEAMRSKLQDEAASKAATAGRGEKPKWMQQFLLGIEDACGMPFRGSRDHTGEYSVMLDHAARRVSIAYSWIKRAEAERCRFEADALRLAEVPAAAMTWLDSYCATRTVASGALDDDVGYRIRRRAIGGWDEVIAKWRRAKCATAQDRIAAARETQADPDIEKFGDIQLFEALSQDDAECVWRPEGRVNADLLKDYVAGHEARFKQRRFKVPAYRHPDPLVHPVFVDFGTSRWEIQYAVHAAAKPRGKRKPTEAEAEWFGTPRGVRLGLWNGKSVQPTELRWSSKRLTRDLIGQNGVSRLAGVPRADRLGRAAGGVVDTAPVRPVGLFELAMWNGRLQAPRAQLDALAARVRAYGWDDRARSMRQRVNWLLTFSAKLECRGPMHTYLERFEGDEPSRPYLRKTKKGVVLDIMHDENKSREGNAKLILSRLPGLRVLSVDLGHRFAAACAVWQVLSAKDLADETTGRSIIRGSSDAQSLLLHTRHCDPATGKNRITIYRRIGTDRVSDGRTHPGPWARLERQFLVKLQGEEGPTRKAAPMERTAVSDLERAVGRLRDASAPLPTDVGGLMADAVRTARLALRRHGDAARIAYAFSPDATHQLPGGGSELHSAESRVGAIREALVRWFDLACGDRWHDAWAAEAWVRTLECDLPTLPAALTPGARRRVPGSIEEQLAPIAARLVARGTHDIHRLWLAHWRDLDREWRPRLRWLRDWILPRGLRADKKESPDHSAERKNRRRAARWVGGLSLTRISTVRELYQLQKAFAMRPHPDDLRQNVALRGDDRFDKFGSSVLLVMERLRTQRVKQTASRIIEAALGIGRAPAARGRVGQRKRPLMQVDAPCHVVVVENLRNYRPDELQTRRENRQLLQWAAGKVRDRLTEACQLQGVYLRDVQPNYTSRQCSRSGLPGVRCQDVAVHDFLTKAHWTRMTDDAVKRLSEGRSDSLDAMLRDLRERWMNAPSGAEARGRPLRIPRTGGDLFVASAPQSREGACVQADLNAAANIGLRALLDPDFPGKWWYVPCDSSTGMPRDDRCAGATCFDRCSALLAGGTEEGSEKPKGRESRRGGVKDVTNAWRDMSAQATSDGEWVGHAQYWAGVRARVIRHLRQYNGLNS